MCRRVVSICSGCFRCELQINPSLSAQLCCRRCKRNNIFDGLTTFEQMVETHSGQPPKNHGEKATCLHATAVSNRGAKHQNRHQESGFDWDPKKRGFREVSSSLDLIIKTREKAPKDILSVSKNVRIIGTPLVCGGMSIVILISPHVFFPVCHNPWCKTVGSRRWILFACSSMSCQGLSVLFALPSDAFLFFPH